MILESVFAVVDMYFGEHLPNAKEEVAIIGLTEPLITLVYILCIGLSTAITAIVAWRIDEKDIKGDFHAVAQTILLSLIVAVAISVEEEYFLPKIF